VIRPAPGDSWAGTSSAAVASGAHLTKRVGLAGIRTGRYPVGSVRPCSGSSSRTRDSVAGRLSRAGEWFAYGRLKIVRPPNRDCPFQAPCWWQVDETPARAPRRNARIKPVGHFPRRRFLQRSTRFRAEGRRGGRRRAFGSSVTNPVYCEQFGREAPWRGAQQAGVRRWLFGGRGGHDGPPLYKRTRPLVRPWTGYGPRLGERAARRGSRDDRVWDEVGRTPGGQAGAPAWAPHSGGS